MVKALCLITQDYKIVCTYVVRELDIVYIQFSITKIELFNSFFKIVQVMLHKI